jgi:DNA processing protein
MQHSEDLKYQIALSQVHKIGPYKAKVLYKSFGSAKAVFEASIEELIASKVVNLELAQSIRKKEHFQFAEEELEFIKKYNIQALSYGSPNYPKRLVHFDDAPLLLYYKGNADLNSTRIVGIVGTRKPTEYGRKHCERIVQELKAYNAVILSGLAYGIDATAHRKALFSSMDTIGVVAHGLDRIYPHKHRKLAERMVEQGGLLSEFPSRTEPVPGNFPARNRIIAALADAIVVVETANSGGSMITANMANAYQKDVFAVPGSLESPSSEGCNQLIKTHRASLLTSASDIAYLLRWEKQKAAQQKQIFIDLSAEERLILDQLLGGKTAHLNQLMQSTAMSTSRLSSYLLELEMKGLLKALPGKYYRLA